MKVVSVKVDEETKKKMESFPDINWSEVIRRSISRRLETEEALRKGIDRKRALRAAMSMDRLRKRSSGQWSGSEEIRKWRQRR
ncbi:MAG: VapB-type antitoxin [Thermoplasmata archaeon]